MTAPPPSFILTAIVDSDDNRRSDYTDDLMKFRASLTADKGPASERGQEDATDVDDLLPTSGGFPSATKINPSGLIGPGGDGRAHAPDIISTYTYKHQWIGKLHLVEVAALRLWFGVSGRTAFELLKSLEVPLFYIGNSTYFEQAAFEERLGAQLAVGADGFAAPGSWYKNSGKAGRNKTGLVPKTKVVSTDGNS